MPGARRRQLDSWAVLALLNDEVGAGAVADHLRRAFEGGDTILINEINVGEVFYIVGKHRSIEAAERTLDHLRTVPLEVVGNTHAEVIDAARVEAVDGLITVEWLR